LLQSYALLTILGLHVIGALKHGFVDQDNALYGMLPINSLKNDPEEEA
jgi:cytochrome b561